MKSTKQFKPAALFQNAKTIVSILLLGMAVFVSQGAWALGGSGTKASPYTISSEADLREFADIVNGTNAKTLNANAFGVLTGDITLTRTWTPMGSSANPYTGTFDGQGHTISHLDINLPGTDRVGLFGAVGGGAVIQRLVLDSSCRISGHAFVGLIGSSEGNGVITLRQLGNEGNVTAEAQNAAGIIGCNMNSTATFIISDCYATGTITGVEESAAISGWVGSKATVTHCYSAAVVKGSDGNARFLRGTGKVTECFDMNVSTDTKKITKTDITGGKLCYLLNAGRSDENVLWRQNLKGTAPVDGHPVLNSTHHIVFLDDQGYYNIVDALEPLPAADAAIEGIYDLNGRRLDTLRPGINLIRRTDGTIQKVLY